MSYTELLGTIAATITTLCWLPQVVRVLRTRETRALSLIMYIMLTIGIVLWLLYGLLIVSWPLIIGNIVTLIFAVTLLLMKLRYG